MFTGIIEEIGTIKNILRSSRSISIEIEGEKVLEDVKIGDSIATNGVCLTVTSVTAHTFRADVMPETMRMTNLGSLHVGDRVNLERALTPATRLGGHLVAGHIDGTGRIIHIEREDTAIWITVSAPPDILKYVVHKGSIAIDGVSLTVATLQDGCFNVSVIPHTQQATTLTGKKTGDIVNLENDMIVRYVERLMEKKDNTMTLDALMRNGF